MTYLYQLFPNVMIATFPDLVSVVAIDPVDVDHTTVTTYSMVNPKSPPELSPHAGPYRPGRCG